MNEIEKMYKLANVAKPVIKKWYYDGYYEDFSWQSSEEDCTELLEYFDNSIDKLNDRIQQMKKEENTKYDRYTDSVDTEFGRVEKAYIKYPPFTAKKQLELIKLFGSNSIGFGTCIEECCRKENFEEALAGRINDLWYFITEKEQVRSVLK